MFKIFALTVLFTAQALGNNKTHHHHHKNDEVPSEY